ncbi:MAG: GNAT family N-acetyltransferase [Rhodospirillales bacterium]|nr:GNAT family N-acetyltransferase [Rhodospirillales bacterium]
MLNTGFGERLPHTLRIPFSPTIFHEPWWLARASGGAYQEVTADLGGQLAGRLPFIMHRWMKCFTTIHIPALTHCLGPAISPALDRPGAVKSFKPIQICAQLLQQLPKAAHIWFRLHPDTTNTLAFETAGFSSNVQWSVEIAPAASDVLWKQMRDKTRNAIRRAGDTLQVTESDDEGFFLDFYNACLHEAGRRNSYDEDCLKQLGAEILLRNRGRVLVAARADGTPQAAILTVWDTRREYYFMSSRQPGAHFGAVNLLLWHALQNAAARGRIFDMDGIHVVGTQTPNLLLLSGFGGSIVPRYCVSRSSATGNILRKTGRAFRR